MYSTIRYPFFSVEQGNKKSSRTLQTPAKNQKENENSGMSVRGVYGTNFGDSG